MPVTRSVLGLAIQATGAGAVGFVRAGAELAGFELTLLAELATGLRRPFCGIARRTTNQDERAEHQAQDWM